MCVHLCALIAAIKNLHGCGKSHVLSFEPEFGTTPQPHFPFFNPFSPFRCCWCHSQTFARLWQISCIVLFAGVIGADLVTRSNNCNTRQQMRRRYVFMVAAACALAVYYSAILLYQQDTALDNTEESDGKSSLLSLTDDGFFCRCLCIFSALIFPEENAEPSEIFWSRPENFATTTASIVSSQTSSSISSNKQIDVLENSPLSEAAESPARQPSKPSSPTLPSVNIDATAQSPTQKNPPLQPLQQTSQPSHYKTGSKSNDGKFAGTSAAVSPDIRKLISKDDNARLIKPTPNVLPSVRLALVTAYQETLLLSPRELTGLESSSYDVSEVLITRVPQNGSVNYWLSANSGKSEVHIRYKPKQRYVGTDSFSYVVTLISSNLIPDITQASSSSSSNLTQLARVNQTYIVSGNADIRIGFSPMLTASQLPFPQGYVLAETKLNQACLPSSSSHTRCSFLLLFLCVLNLKH